MKLVNLYIVLFIIGLCACVEVDIIDSYSSSSIEYMLLSDDDRKDWALQQQTIDGVVSVPESCLDSSRLVFEYIDDDSLVAYELFYDDACMLYDSIIWGTVEISENSDETFTDSLILTSGENNTKYFHLDHLKKDELTISYVRSGVSYNKIFSPRNSKLRTEQVVMALSNGLSSGEKTWRLKILKRSTGTFTPKTCEDNMWYRFVNTGDYQLQLQQITVVDSTDCLEYDTAFMANLNIGNQEPTAEFNDYLIATNTSFDTLFFERAGTDRLIFDITLEETDYTFTVVAE